MKILVTGKNGKLVTYIRNYIKRNKEEWDCDFISLRTDEWRKLPFNSYDAIIHCAGIVSSSKDDYSEYYKVNVELTKKLFEEVLRQKGKRFIYLSSMAVYDGLNWGFGQDGIITARTQPTQKTYYGKSKFEAEEIIRELRTEDVSVAIVRAPSIVGGGLEAYFDKYIMFSKIPFLPIPWIHSEAKRSFVYIDTLIDYLFKLCESKEEGIFFPQNFPQLSVSEIMEEVSKNMGKNKKVWENASICIPRRLQKRFFTQICYDSSLSNDELFFKITTKEAIAKAVKGTSN